MPDPVTGIGAAVSIGGAVLKGKSASKAGQLQYDAAMAGVDETRQAREEMRALLQPYTEAGGPALQAQMAALMEDKPRRGRPPKEALAEA